MSNLRKLGFHKKKNKLKNGEESHPPLQLRDIGVEKVAGDKNIYIYSPKSFQGRRISRELGGKFRTVATDTTRVGKNLRINLAGGGRFLGKRLTKVVSPSGNTLSIVGPKRTNVVSMYNYGRAAKSLGAKIIDRRNK